MRIVSASLRPLEEEIAAGRFREDLFFRINTVTIHLPPLRERKEDIPLLARAFLEEFATAGGKKIEGFEDDVLEVLEQHDWPGNVRELRNVIERAVLFCRSDRVRVEDLPAGFGGRSAAGPCRATGKPVPLHKAVEIAEINAIRCALGATRGRRAEAAELLGISRKTLWEKMKNYGIEA